MSPSCASHLRSASRPSIIPAMCVLARNVPHHLRRDQGLDQIEVAGSGRPRRFVCTDRVGMVRVTRTNEATRWSLPPVEARRSRRRGSSATNGREPPTAAPRHIRVELHLEPANEDTCGHRVEPQERWTLALPLSTRITAVPGDGSGPSPFPTVTPESRSLARIGSRSEDRLPTDRAHGALGRKAPNQPIARTTR